MEEVLTAGVPACVSPIIRRNLRTASIMGLLHGSETPDGPWKRQENPSSCAGWHGADPSRKLPAWAV